MPPDSLCNFINLRELSLYDNQIKEIPDSFSNLVNLQHLSLSNNQIKKIPYSFSNLVNLQKLWLGNNQIKEIPISIINLRRLSIFKIDNNPIEIVNPIVQRFLDRINNRGGNIYNVYDNRQNVHTSSIQQSIKKSIINILSFSL